MACARRLVGRAQALLDPLAVPVEIVVAARSPNGRNVSVLLSITNLSKTFADQGKGSVQAVNGVSFEVSEGELLTMLGPSGCGKTTSLRCVAGLVEPNSGTIQVAGRTMADPAWGINVPTHKRGLGMVFQSYAIWPHMTVYKNVEYVLRSMKGKRRIVRSKISDRIEEVLSLVHLLPLKDRPATKLSGGQQQRLALARAIAVEPPLLLLDEPLSNLDQKLREQMRIELKRMQRELGITTLYVTHDQVEAMALSNKIAVMRGGKIEQFGSPRDIYNRPGTPFVATFVGSTNLFEGTVREVRRNMCWINTKFGTIVAERPSSIVVGERVVLSVRPENIRMNATEVERPGNQWAGTIQRREFLGEATEFHVQVGESVVRVRSKEAMPLRKGEAVTLHLRPEWCAVISSG